MCPALGPVRILEIRLLEIATLVIFSNRLYLEILVMFTYMQVKSYFITIYKGFMLEVMKHISSCYDFFFIYIFFLYFKFCSDFLFRSVCLMRNTGAKVSLVLDVGSQPRSPTHLGSTSTESTDTKL